MHIVHTPSPPADLRLTGCCAQVREAHPDGAKTLQLYVWRDRVLLKEVLDRAKE